MKSDIGLLVVLHFCPFVFGLPGGCHSRCFGRGRDGSPNEQLSPSHDHAAGSHGEETTPGALITVLPMINDSGQLNIEHATRPVVVEEWAPYMNRNNWRDEREYTQSSTTRGVDYLRWMYGQNQLHTPSNPHRYFHTSFRIREIPEAGTIKLQYDTQGHKRFAVFFEIDPIRLQHEYVRVVGRFLRKVMFLGTLWTYKKNRPRSDGSSTSATRPEMLYSTEVNFANDEETFFSSAFSWTMDYSQNEPPQVRARFFKNSYRKTLQVAMKEIMLMYEITGHWTDVQLIGDAPHHDGASSSTALPPDTPERPHGSPSPPHHDPTGKGKGKIP